MEKIASLCKRRGFIFPGSEIYGGLGGFYDFGPLGAELKFNIKQAWWKSVVLERDDVVGLNAAIIMNPKAWEASGHVAGFSDILLECKKCHKRYRDTDLYHDQDQYVARKQGGHGLREEVAEVGNRLLERRKEERIKKGCENCGSSELTEPRSFNLMFKTFVGPIEDEAAIAYLRPETAGGIFVNFRNVLDTMRIKIPFGIAQIGRAFRNEINPKDFVFRTREFEQMELEYFVKPGEDETAFQLWVDERLAWYERIGLHNVHVREQSAEERAHYSKRTVDVEYDFSFGRKEIEGIANRADFDLTQHAKHSGKDLSYFDEEKKQSFIPYVIEPSAGVERITFALLCDAYHEDEKRVVLQLIPSMAPYKAAVFPLLANKPELVRRAQIIYQGLKKHFMVAWDDRGNIGKRYYSQDEIGTPFCITVDFETLEDGTVTVRDRNTMNQVRIHEKDLVTYLREKIDNI